MSAFDTTWDSFAAPALMTEHGEAGIYHPHGSAADVPVTCIATKERSAARQEGKRELRVREREATISTDPSSTYGGVAAVDTRSAFTLGGVKYSIAGTRGADGSFIVLVLQRPELGGVFPRDPSGRGG